MEVFWIVVGVVIVVLVIINQNRTKVSNRTVITRNRTIQTEDGEIRIQQTQVVDSVSTQYTKPNQINQDNHNVYDQSAIASYNSAISDRRAKDLEMRKDRLITPPPKTELLISPPPFVDKQRNSAIASISGVKKCTRCSRELDLSLFRKSSKNLDGHTIWCAHCLDGPRNTKHTKWCPICEKQRRRSTYDKNSNNADGLMSWCKHCCDVHLR